MRTMRLKPFELDPTSFSTPTEDEQDHSTRFLAVSEMSRITSGLVDDSGHVVTRAWDDDDDMMIMSFFFVFFPQLLLLQTGRTRVQQ